MKALFFEYRLTLNAPLVLTDNSGDPNSANTSITISGSTIRGAVASAILKSNFDKDTEEKYLNDYILSDSISFLPAYPEIKGMRGYPLPSSLKKEKHNNENLKNLFAYTWVIDKKNIQDEDDECDEDDGEDRNWPDSQLKNCFELINLGDSNLKSFTPETEGKFHNQIDSNKGRAWTNEKEESLGAIFSYESIKEGQSFRGVIKITGQTDDEISNKRKKIFELLPNKNRIFLGKSKIAGYGGNAELEWLDQEGKTREISKYRGLYEIKNGSVQENEIFYLYLTSPYIGRDSKTGCVDPYAIFDDIRNLFGENNIEICENNARICSSTKQIGGFNKKWQCEFPQVASLDAGSIISLKAKKLISKDDILEKEQKGLGIRKNEGFGSFLLLEKNNKIDFSLLKFENEVEERPNDIVENETLSKMEESIVLKQLEKIIVTKVTEDLRSGNVKNIPPNYLLGRFRNLINNNSIDNTIKNLKIWLGDGEHCLKSQAKNHLRKCKIKNQTLLDLLKSISNDTFRDDFYASFKILKNYFFIKEDCDKAFEEFKQNNKDKIKIDYLNTLIKMMALKNRTTEGGK